MGNYSKKDGFFYKTTREATSPTRDNAAATTPITCAPVIANEPPLPDDVTGVEVLPALGVPGGVVSGW